MMLRILQSVRFVFVVSLTVSQAREDDQEGNLLKKACPINDECLIRLKDFEPGSKNGRIDDIVGQTPNLELINEECDEVLKWCQRNANVDDQNRADDGANITTSNHESNENESQMQLESPVKAGIIRLTNSSPAIANEEESNIDVFSELEMNNDVMEVEVDLDEAPIDEGAPPSKLQYMIAVLSAALLVYATIFGATRIIQVLARIVSKYAHAFMNFGYGYRKAQEASAQDVEPPQLDKRKALASLKHRMRLDQEALALAKSKRANTNPAEDSGEGSKHKVHLD